MKILLMSENILTSSFILALYKVGAISLTSETNSVESGICSCGNKHHL